MRINNFKFSLVIIAIGFAFPTAFAGDKTIILQSTTSTQSSGLFDHILPIFKSETGISVKVVAVGTGQALKNGRNGDGDVVLVHAKSAEQKFIKDGFGLERRDVMYNDFIVIGPENDPADLAGAANLINALNRIASSKSPFVSRGDDSGTHKKEQQLWKIASVNPFSGGSDWYHESGSGMGAALNMAAGMGAYTLSDRATWIAFANKGGMKILSEGDPLLFNQYGVMLINPAVHPHVKKKSGNAFIQWLTNPPGQSAIGSYQLDGKQLFFPNSNPSSN